MNNQRGVYNDIYTETEYDFELPDYKITGGKSLKDKKILILGVGTGRDTRFLSKANDVYGIDFSSEAIKLACKHGIRGKVGDLSKRLKYQSNFFDIVVAKDIFEHLENPIFLLKEVRRVLKTNGYTVINVPNQFFFGFRLRILFGSNLIWKTLGHDHTKLFNEWDYMHVRFFTWQGFKKFLKIGRFRIVKTFWDFGTLAHYSQPENVFIYLEQKSGNENLIKVLKSAWAIFNFSFPRRIRSFIVSLSPSLMCTSFYVWSRKDKK